MLELAAITTLVDLFSLAASLGLGFYIITRSPHSRLSWLATLALWFLASFFVHNSIAINLPGSGILPWLRQVGILVLPVWYHLTTLLLPSSAKRFSGRFISSNLLTLVGTYVIAIILLSMGVFTRDLLSVPAATPEISASLRLAGPFYPIFVIYFLVIALLCIRNLWRARSIAIDPSLRQQLSLLFLASTLVGAGVFYLIMGVWLRLPIPTLPGDMTMGVGVILLGVAVARYNALLEGRQIDRDFRYTLLAVGSLTCFYVLCIVVLYWGGQISFLTLVLTVVGTISFNTLYDGIRVALDRFFYHGNLEKLRAGLRALANEAGTGQTLNDQLQSIVVGLCRTMRVRNGFIALRNERGFSVVASLGACPIGQEFALSILSTNETIGIVRPHCPELEGMVLLVPLHGGKEQIGAAVLGPKETKQPYTEQDLEFLDDLAELATVIHSLRRQEERIQTISAMVAEYRERERALQQELAQMLIAKPTASEPIDIGLSEDEMLEFVEQGLRCLSDFSYLGEHELTKLAVVKNRLKKNGESTLIDRGKAVNEVLLHALEKLRPEGAVPKDSEIRREWHQFIVLHDSYVVGELTRDIMSKLYIGEGTFNRTRKRALRSVAKVLIEMEQEARSS